VEVFDTAGLDEYRALRDGWIRESHAFMLVYSIASRSSFDHLIKLRNEVLRVKQKDVPMMLVGNRCVSRAQRRLVSVREGTTLAEQFGSLFEEMDCESGFNVDNAFFNLVRGIRRETT
jgi:GTPase KRas protein